MSRAVVTMEEDVDKLWEWYLSFRKGSNDYRAVLESRLLEETRPDLRAQLFSLLGMECARLEDVTGHIDVFERAVSEFPAEPFMWTSLAGAYSYLGHDLTRALQIANKAVEVARSTGKFRRQVLHSKARLLRDAKDYRGLERCVVEIMHEPKSLTADVAKEDDFLRNLPPGTLSDDVLKRYAEFMVR